MVVPKKFPSWSFKDLKVRLTVFGNDFSWDHDRLLVASFWCDKVRQDSRSLDGIIWREKYTVSSHEATNKQDIRTIISYGE